MLVGGGNSFGTFNYVIARSWRVSRLQVSGFFILVTSTQVLSSSCGCRAVWLVDQLKLSAVGSLWNSFSILLHILCYLKRAKFDVIIDENAVIQTEEKEKFPR